MRTVLSARGRARHVESVFLLVWLAGWAAGELAVGAVLLFALAHTLFPAWTAQHWPPATVKPATFGVAVVLFLVLWLALWTIGGLAAIGALLRNFGGRDEVWLDGDALIHRWIAGPLRRSKRLPRARIHALELGPARLDVHHSGGVHTLTTLGTADERAALMARLSTALPTQRAWLPVPWRGDRRGDAVVLERPATVARAMAGFLYGATALCVVAELSGPALIAVMLATAFATWQRQWRFDPHDVTRETRLLGLRFVRCYRAVSINTSQHRDSDGDEWNSVTLTGADGAVTLYTGVRSAVEMEALAAWLNAERAGRAT